MSARAPAPLLGSALAVLRKDLLAEWRTRIAVNALFLFAFAVLVLVGYAVGPTRLAPEDRPTVNAVLLWIVIFFSAMTGLSRVFVKEEEGGTAAALRLAAPPAAVLLGKYLVNIVLLFAVTAFIVPLFLVLMSFEIACPALFAVLLVLNGTVLNGRFFGGGFLLPVIGAFLFFGAYTEQRQLRMRSRLQRIFASFNQLVVECALEAVVLLLRFAYANLRRNIGWLEYV